jgi:hypothetical protein
MKLHFTRNPAPDSREAKKTFGKDLGDEGKGEE